MARPWLDSYTFALLDWYSRMTFAYERLLTAEQHEELAAWERAHLGDDRHLRTSDWPGWLDIIGHGPPDPGEWPDRSRKQPIPKALRWEVFERDDFTCRACGTGDDLTADHIIPESLGGPTTLANLQTLCRSCNSAKGTSTNLPGTGVPAN